MLFGGEVLGCEQERRSIGVQETGVGKPLSARSLCGVDHGLVLRYAMPKLAA